MSFRARDHNRQTRGAEQPLRAPSALESLVAEIGRQCEVAAFLPEVKPQLVGNLNLLVMASSGFEHSALRLAAEDTADVVCQWRDLLQYRDILHLPLRGRWINAEHKALTSYEESLPLETMRTLFERNRFGCPPITALHHDVRRALARIGGENFIRLLRSTDQGSPCREERKVVHYGMVAGFDRYHELSPHQLRDVRFRPSNEGWRALGNRLSFEAYTADNPPSPKVVKELEAINSKLLIDPERPSPQEGFGRLLDAETMREWWFTAPNAHLFLLRLDGAAEGYLMIFPGWQGWPESGRLAACHLFPSRFSQPGWLEMVAITHEAREVFKQNATGAYSPLLSFALEASLDINVDALYCMVREGPTANTAKTKHIREGFCDLGVQFDFHATPYGILALDVEDQVDLRILELSSNSKGRALLEDIRRVSC